MRRSDICLYLGPADRAELQALISNRNTVRKLVWRAEIVLATADGQLLILALEISVETDRDEGRHEDRGAQAGASAADHLLSLPLARTAREPRQPGEARGLFRLEGAELRHLDQQRARGHVADAPDGGQDVETPGQVGIVGNPGLRDDWPEKFS